ncbi:MAG TPA: divalent metal cation transporter [Gemmatimonadaceae bacterium]|nr:divalent metal cation transporter [Gemmatimonadaceae bacterium]
MKRLLGIALGIVTSIGGFLEIGSITTAAQAGADFHYQLIWAVVLGTLCIALLIEMSGRFAAVSKHTIADAMRERFGLHFFMVPVVLVFFVSLLVLAAEIGGVCVALELVTGIHYSLWGLPVGLLAWGLLWYGTFSVIENGVSMLGLITIAFLVAALQLGPDWHALGAGLVPTLPDKQPAHYWFIAVSILGASISPYLFYFYSSGAIEEKWDVSYLAANRTVAAVGMGFGGFLNIAVLVVSALVLAPRGISVEKYAQLPLLLTTPWGRLGLALFAGCLFITCLGATTEIALALAYQIAQGFGWNWGEDIEPKDDARFSLMYTVTLLLATILVVVGLDPLKLTTLSMALTAASLPVSIVPFLVLMNDRSYLGEHTNGWLGNLSILIVSVLAAVVALVSIPLEIAGGS